MPHSFSSPHLFLGRKTMSFHFARIEEGPLCALNDMLEIIHEAAKAIGAEAHQQKLPLDELHEALKELALNGNFSGYLKNLIEGEGAFARMSDKGKDLPQVEFWTHGELDSTLDQISEQIQYDLRALRRIHKSHPYQSDANDPKLSKLKP